METLARAYPSAAVSRSPSSPRPTAPRPCWTRSVRRTGSPTPRRVAAAVAGPRSPSTPTPPPRHPVRPARSRRLRAGLDRSYGAYVGGPSAQQLDLADSQARDRRVVVPLVLAAVFVILVGLLRSLVAPLMLLVAVVAVWGAALGIGGLVFHPLLGFEGTDPGLGLLSFVFLVALGVDYGIFLMHRMREESLAGAAPQTAALTALRTTGGVIASAGRRPGGDVRRPHHAAAGGPGRTGLRDRGRRTPRHVPCPYLPGDDGEHAAAAEGVVAWPALARARAAGSAEGAATRDRLLALTDRCPSLPEGHPRGGG